MNLTPWQILALCAIPVIVVIWFWAALVLGKLADKNIRAALQKMRDENEDD